MKKTWMTIFFLTLLGSGLTYQASSFLQGKEDLTSIEKDAVIHITVDDKNYATALTKLWNKTYPEHKDALIIKSKVYAFKQSFQQDIEWIKDSDVAYREQDAYSISTLQDHVEFPVEPRLQRSKEYFMPVEGKGLVFVYNEKTMKERNLTIEHISSIEAIQKLPGHSYYHNRFPEYAAPFLFLDKTQSQEEAQPLDNLFTDASFQRNLSAYRQLSLSDDSYQKDDFFEDSYLCGLVESDHISTKSTSYRNGSLHFIAMPVWQGKQLSPFMDSYGFIVNKDVAYPKATQAFLSMVRSHDGIQALVDHTKKLPIISDKDLEQLSIYDHTKREIITALQSSQLRNITQIKEKPSITIDDVYQNSRLYTILQNSLFSKDSDEQVIRSMQAYSEKWIYQQ